MNSNTAKNDSICEISDNLAKFSPEDILQFFGEILTPTELETISKRWSIIKMLNDGCSQREISKELNVSLCKVTRGAKILKDKNSILSKHFSSQFSLYLQQFLELEY